MMDNCHENLTYDEKDVMFRSFETPKSFINNQTSDNNTDFNPITQVMNLKNLRKFSATQTRTKFTNK